MSARRLLGVTVTLGLTAALAGASRLPLATRVGEDALVRVAWTARPERIERCRTLADEELRKLPAHMRQRVVCEGGSATYHVEIRRDERVLASDRIRGGGLRHDRQLYHFRELRVPSGPMLIGVTLTRIDSISGLRAAGAMPPPRPAVAKGSDASSAPLDGGEQDTRGRRLADALPPHIVLREQVVLRPGEVLLVTYDRDRRQLRTLQGGSR